MIVRLAWGLLCLVACGQPFTQRGYFEDLSTLYPHAAINDSSHAVLELLLRYEASYQVFPWLKLNGSIDARTDTHRQVERGLDFSWDDRSLRRPAIALRRLSAIANKGRFTVEVGRQSIRWGRADILNPVDRFAPKDFLNVVNTDFLGVVAARVTYESGANTVDLVWQPWFTPSRTPLLNQRWTVLPEAVRAIPIRDNGADYPSRSQFGARWNHVGQGYEFAASYFDGYNYLPLFHATAEFSPSLSLALQRYYPRLRLYGADAAIPTQWATVKMEAAYFTTARAQTDEYLLYVLQIERQQGDWIFVGGYAGEVVTKAVSNPLQFSPERGFARSFLGRAEYTISPSRSLAMTGAARQNGKGTWLRFEYSQMVGRHWRATGGVTWIRGDEMDFLGQYHRNSYASLALRYSF
jgi:hypothetical protein